MIETKFETIDSKTLVAANQVAERMIKELTSLKSDYRDIRELYFTCIEIFDLIYGTKTTEKVEEQFFLIANILNKDVFYNKENWNYNAFWNVIITSDKNGNECDVDKFLKNLKIKFGKETCFVSYLTNVAKKLYQNCNDEKLETYGFIFLDNYCKSLISIQFEGIISKTEINNVLLNLKRYNVEDYAEDIKIYLDQHHFAYRNFKVEKQEISNEFQFDLDNINEYCYADFISKYIPNTKNIYGFINYQIYLDEDSVANHLLLIKCVNDNLYVLHQREYISDDGWGDYIDVHYEFFKSYRYANFNDKSFVGFNYILPSHTFFAKLSGLLSKIEDINSDEEIKELFKDDLESLVETLNKDEEY